MTSKELNSAISWPTLSHVFSLRLNLLLELPWNFEHMRLFLSEKKPMNQDKMSGPLFGTILLVLMLAALAVVALSTAGCRRCHDHFDIVVGQGDDCPSQGIEFRGQSPDFFLTDLTVDGCDSLAFRIEGIEGCGVLQISLFIRGNSYDLPELREYEKLDVFLGIGGDPLGFDLELGDLCGEELRIEFVDDYGYEFYGAQEQAIEAFASCGN